MNIKHIKKYNPLGILETNNLKPMESVDIVCGINFGLPFDYLMTDIYSGCLLLNCVCYGNCTAALYCYNNRYNFGKKVLNNFNEDAFRKSVCKLPKGQK